MACADDFKVTRSGSLGGFAININTTAESGKNRIVDHRYPKRDDHDLEPMGRDADRFNISGYITDIDAAGDKIRRLRNVLKNTADQSFFNPYDGEMYSVRVEDWNINEDRNIGRVEFTFSAYKVVSTWSISPVAESNAQARLDGGRDEMAATLDAYLQQHLYAATFDADVATLWTTIDTVQSLNFEADRTAYRAQLSQNRYGSSMDAIDEVDTTSISGVYADGNLTTQTLDLVDVLYEDTLNSGRAFRLFNLLTVGAMPTVSGVSGARVTQAAQLSAMDTVLRVAALRGLANVVINHDYQDKQSAHDLRFSFSQTALELRQHITSLGETDLHDIVSETIATVGEAYRTLTDSLKPVAYQDVCSATSVLALAWDFYQNPEQAEDLLARNESRGGVFSGQSIEYLVQ